MDYVVEVEGTLQSSISMVVISLRVIVTQGMLWA